MRKLNSKGITLVALVVTIVVLIILAGVTLASLTGEKGIIKEARTAKELAEKASLEEQVDLAIIKAEQKHRNPGIDDVIEELKSSKVISKDEQVNKETGAIITDLGYEITGKLDDYIGKVSTGDNEGNTSGGNTTGNNTTGGDATNPSKPTTLPNTENTKPFLPEDSEIISDSLETGVIIKDKNNNEWVWIEVPKSIYTSTTTNTDYSVIERAMQTYATDYRNYDTYYSCSDKYYEYSSIQPFENATEYNNHKNSMLKSVFENGGFYIGRYETGTEEPRFSYNTESEPLIQRDKRPYNFVGWTHAQEAVQKLAIDEKTSSLMFGIQWDLVLKFIEVKGGKTQNQLKKDSTTWGNYKDMTFEITRGFYSSDPGIRTSWDSKKYTKPIGTGILCTTGVSDRNSVLGIYDLAGNLYELTLEAESRNQRIVVRGGNGLNSGISGTWSDGTEYVGGVGSRNTFDSYYGTAWCGFRATLW